MFFVISCALVRYTWLSNSSRFFPTITTFGCFWSQWPTSLAVTSGREGVRTTSFKPWRPHRGSCRGATAIEENNGSRREQWLTSLTVWTVHSICTYMIFIYIDISLYLSIYLSVYLSLSILVGRHLCQCGASRQQKPTSCRYDTYKAFKFIAWCKPNDAVRAVAVAKRREYKGYKGTGI